MLQCLVCDDWYHARCVGIRASQADDLRYVCHVCQPVRPVIEPAVWSLVELSAACRLDSAERDVIAILMESLLVWRASVADMDRLSAIDRNLLVAQGDRLPIDFGMCCSNALDRASTRASLFGPFVVSVQGLTHRI